MKINQLTQFETETLKDEKNFLSQFQTKGITNAVKLEEIKTKLYLGDYKGKKVNFYTTFTRDEVICKSSIDLEVVGGNFKQLNTYLNGRTKSFIGNFPTTRKGGSNITKITLAYLMAFSHICEYKKVGFVNNRPSKELVRELMYLTMPEVEGRNEDSKMYGITWSSVIEAWKLQANPNYDMYKKYFNSLINTDLKNMNEVRSIKLTEKAS